MGRNLRRLLLSLLALIIVVVLVKTPLWHLVQSVSQPWLKPIAKLSYNIGDWLNQLWHLADLRQENENLRYEVAELSARQAASKSVYQENEELRKLLGLPEVVGYGRLAVEIIGEQVDETGTSYIINRGSEDGLIPGLAAVVGSTVNENDDQGLVLVGTLSDVGWHTSSLRLITSSSSQVLVTLAQNPTAHSLAVGEYNLAVRLRYLQIDQPIAVGDEVMTSNLSALIPPGLLLGMVTAVESVPGQLFQTAVVSPPVQLERFRYLYVLRPLIATEP